MRKFVSLTSLFLVFSFTVTEVPASAATITWGVPSSVVINEIGCDAQAGEFVELANIDAIHPVSLAGWVISDKSLDNTEANHDYKFPAGSKLAAGGYVVLRSGIGGKLPFGIACADDSIRLAAVVNGKLGLHEEVAVPNLADGFTWSRFITSPKLWQASVPTSGSANVVAPAGSVVDRAAFLYDPELEHNINLTLTTAARIELARQTRDDHKTYVPAKFSITTSSGERFPATGTLDVGIRLKGSVGSFCPLVQTSELDCQKPAFKIKFDAFVPGQTFFGLKKMTLNNMVQDPSMTNQVLSYQLFRDYGIVASRTGFASVTLDNFEYGLYLNLEQYDDISLAWHYPVVTHLFEGQHGGAYPSTPDLLNPGYEAKFPVDEGDENDISDLEELIYELSNLRDETDQFSPSSGLNNYDLPSVDEKQIGIMMAIEKYISHWDGYSGTPWWTPNNHYLLNPDGSGFHILPGGADQTWTDWVEPLDTSGASLFKYCMIEIVCRAAFHSTLADLPSHVEDQDYVGKFNHIFDIHEDSRIADIYQGYTEGDRAYHINFKATYISSRVNVVKDYVQYKVSSAMYWTPKSLSLESGTPFTTAHLNAIAAAPGTITYSVNLGSRPAKGLITVVASFDPDDPSLEANEYEVVFKVADRQTLNIPALPTRTLSKKAASNKFTVKATSSSKLTVKATSLTTSVCTVSKLTIQVKKKGKCQIRFSQAGNNNFLAATSVSKYFTVK